MDARKLPKYSYGIGIRKPTIFLPIRLENENELWQKGVQEKWKVVSSGYDIIKIEESKNYGYEFEDIGGEDNLEAPCGILDITITDDLEDLEEPNDVNFEHTSLYLFIVTPNSSPHVLEIVKIRFRRKRHLNHIYYQDEQYLAFINFGLNPSCVNPVQPLFNFDIIQGIEPGYVHILNKFSRLCTKDEKIEINDFMKGAAIGNGWYTIVKNGNTLLYQEGLNNRVNYYTLTLTDNGIIGCREKDYEIISKKGFDKL